MADRKEPPFFNDDSMGAFHYKLPFYETMELFIETLTGTCFELHVSPFEAIISVKAKIQRLEGIPVAQQHLIWNNMELDDEYCLHDYGIAEGCTLKLVLAMRGGPINTRRVTMEDPMKEVADLMESSREDGWEKNLANKQVTYVVYREGDQLNFFRVVDRGDGTLTPLSESLSGGSLYNVYTEGEEDGESSAAAQQSLENSITMNKMKLLKAKMEDMNLNKKPKKSAKLKPRPPVSPHPCSGSLGPSSTRHHRLFRVLPQINQSRHSNTQLPPIRAVAPSPSSSASSAHLSVTRRAPPSFSSSSCYMLQEEEPLWETSPPFAKIRPPPKVSRLDVGSTRLMRDCVYPQLPSLSTRGQPEGTFEAAEPVGEAMGLALLEEAAGLVEPTQPGVPFGDLLSDPLSLDVSTQPEGGLQSLEVGAQHQLPSSSLLSTWTLGTTDKLTSRVDRTQLGSSLHFNPLSPLPTSPSTATRQLTQPIRDHESVAPFPSSAASSAHLSVTKQAPPSFSSSSCYMLRDEEPLWETSPPFAKIRPPPKVSRLDVGSTRLMRDCVYPQLPSLSTRGQPEGTFEAAEPVGEAMGLALLEEAAGLVEPTQPGVPFGDLLSDPLSLDVSTQPEGGLQSLEVGAQHQLPPSSLLSTWTLGKTSSVDKLTSRVDRTQLGSSLHIKPPSPLPTSPSTATRQLTQPIRDHESVAPSPSSAHLSVTRRAPPSFSSSSCYMLQDEKPPWETSPPFATSISPPRLRGIKVDSLGKTPEIISKNEARGITKIANQACKEPPGSLNNSELLASLSTRAAGSSSREGLGPSLGLSLALPNASTTGQDILGSKLPSIPTNMLLQDDLISQMSPLHRAAASYMATNSRSVGGTTTSIRRLGTPTYHLPPVKAPTGSKKKSSKHCFLCGKKTGLATSYECRCGNNFCATHRYAETHDCTYDYKSAGRRFLQETNPLISAPKLPKI